MLNSLKSIFNLKPDSQEENVRNFVLVFLLFLWFVNPINKLIVILFLILIFVLFRFTKNLGISLVLGYFLSSFFPIGKIYYIQLLDIKNFPNLVQLYPIGLVTRVQISVSDVLFAFLVVYSITVWYRKKINFKKITIIDFFLIAFFFYGILADIFVSSNLYFSLFLKKDLFEFIFIYFMIRFIIKDQSLLYKLFLSILISFTLFESFVILQQFIHSSPIGKTLEATFDIESFGQGSDELFFFYRPIGTFIHANLLAMYLAAILPFFAYLITKSNKYFLKIVFFLTVTSLILTLSRAAWLASLISFLIILFYLEYRKKKILIRSLSLKKIILYFLLALPLLFYSVPRVAKISNIFQEGSGLNLRLRQTNEVIELIFQSPLFGTGTGLSVVKAMQKNPKGVFAFFPSEIHNYFLLQAVENGLPYLGFFVIFIFLSLKRLINYKKKSSFFGAVSIITLIIAGLFQPFILNKLLLIILAFNYDRISEESYDNEMEKNSI